MKKYELLGWKKEKENQYTDGRRINRVSSGGSYRIASVVRTGHIDTTLCTGSMCEKWVGIFILKIEFEGCEKMKK